MSMKQGTGLMEGPIAVQNKYESRQQVAMKRDSFGVRVEDRNRESIYIFMFVIQGPCVEV